MIEQALIKTLGFGSKEFIEKAIEAGWGNDGERPKNLQLAVYDAQNYNLSETLLSPAAWKACGKTEGWRSLKDADWHTNGWDDVQDEWLVKRHSFIDALAEEESSKA